MRFSTLTAALLAAAAVAVPAIAEGPVGHERFVNQARTEAAWHDIEVTNIRWDDGVATISGIQRGGRPVSFTAPCRRGVLDCPVPDRYAANEQPKAM